MKKDAETPVNAWNDSRAEARREMDSSRPWYGRSLALLRDMGVPPGRALDLGCGVGEFLHLLRDAGYATRGADGHRAQVDHVRQDGFDVDVADLEKALAYADDSFDLVSCLEVIEHVVRAEHLVREIRRILKPGGVLVLSTPNVAFWRQRARHLLGHAPANEGVHLRFFTHQGLTRVLQDAGLTIVSYASFGPLTGLNVARKLLGLKRVDWEVPHPLRNMFAHNILVAARKPMEPEAS